MLTYSFENLGNDSLYEYLYKCIRKDILDGKIKAREKLPSKRSFAKNLGVSTITVENAYAQLMAEGYLYSVPKSGYYAAEISRHLLTPTPQTEHGGHLLARTKEAEAFASVNDAPSVQKEFPAVVDLVNSRTNQNQFPFALWARLMRQVLSEKQEELMLPAPGAGVPALRRAIAEYLLQYQGMSVTEEQIIIGAGTEYLYGLLIQLLGQDKKYALEDPGYVKMAKVYQSHLVSIAYIPMDENGIQVDALRNSGADILHVSPSHHYPTGVTTPIGRRYELLGWANESRERYIIEDDYDCEFRLAGRPIPSLQSIDRLDKVIYMNTFTKSLASTIRISYMVLPKRLLARFQERLGFYACTVSNFEQYTLAEFISGGYFEKHINRTRNYYRGKRDALLKAIVQSPLSSKVRIHEADAGLHFLMQIDITLPDEELVSRAAQSGIRLSCLSQYYHVSQEEPDSDSVNQVQEPIRHAVLVNYSGLENEKMPWLAQALYQAWYGDLPK